MYLEHIPENVLYNNYWWQTKSHILEKAAHHAYRDQEGEQENKPRIGILPSPASKLIWQANSHFTTTWGGHQLLTSVGVKALTTDHSALSPKTLIQCRDEESMGVSEDLAGGFAVVDSPLVLCVRSLLWQGTFIKQYNNT